MSVESRKNTVLSSLFCGVLCLLGWMAPFCNAFAEGCARPLARLVSLEGRVEVKRATENLWRKVGMNTMFCASDMIRVGRYGRAAIRFRDHTLLRLDGNTTLRLPEKEEEGFDWMALLRGIIHLFSRTPDRLEIRTPFDTAAIEGTELVVRVGPMHASTTVLEGRVQVTAPEGGVVLEEGEESFSGKGTPPLRRPAKPWEAIQWAIHYPFLIDRRYLFSPRSDARAILERALRLHGEGRVDEALTLLDEVPGRHRSADYFNIRAALLLAVGQLEEALGAIETSRALEPGNGVAMALEAVLSLKRNERDRALSMARQAVEVAPQSAVPLLALSLVQQAMFNLELALSSAQRAVELEPRNALALSREAELWLMLGEPGKARAVAMRAAGIEPGLVRVQVTQGFAFLVTGEAHRAEKAFEKAMGRAQGAPMPRLGLGLVAIRKGNITEGRRLMEEAVLLDPANALLRSYLGKAYLEEGLFTRAAVQFELAKQLDPRDPTPWLYDAILQQRLGQARAALDALQHSMSLNDNRAVYRSRLLLDEDLAVRGTGVARIFREQGFHSVARFEGWRSLQRDPASFSAHRFLADSYVGEQGKELARVSELLQATLLQPLGVRFYQPALGDPWFHDPDHTASLSPGYQEYGALFLEEGLHAGFDFLQGTQAVQGGELSVAGLWGNTAAGLGAMEYRSDGFRENALRRSHLRSLFLQQRVTPSTSLQLEGRRRQAEYGDIEMRIDGSSDPDRRRRIDTDTLRAGAAFRRQAGSRLLLSLSRQWERDETHDEEDAGFSLIVRDDGSSSTGSLAELQYLQVLRNGNLIAGLGSFSQDFSRQREQSAVLPGVGTFSMPSEQHDETIRHDNAYLYLDWPIRSRQGLLLGASFDHFSSEWLGEYRNLNPKFGLWWSPNENTTVRLARFRHLRRSPYRIPSLEPTQVMGFNQLHDDYAATDSTTSAVAIEHRHSRRIHGGITFLVRDARTPVYELDTGSTGRVEQSHERLRLYLSGWISRTVSFSLDAGRDRLSVEGAKALWRVEELEEKRAGFGMKFRFGRGVSMNLATTWLAQDVVLAGDRQQTDFTVVDVGMGWRPPGSRWQLTVVGKNLLDRDFRYQDRNFLRNEPVSSPFIPERSVVLRFSVDI